MSERGRAQKGMMCYIITLPYQDHPDAGKHLLRMRTFGAREFKICVELCGWSDVCPEGTNLSRLHMKCANTYSTCTLMD